jgi:SAM-dependent methyltransferase
MSDGGPRASGEILEPVVRYYTEKLTAYGCTSRGVDWNSDESQQQRFTQLLRMVDDGNRDGDDECILLDYGCGYGALADRLLMEGRHFRYVGFDLCTPMIERARATVRDPRCSFTDDESALPLVDYTVASGIFNIRLDTPEDTWREHVFGTLDRLARQSRKGFAFNMLTRYADRDKLRDYLYYADPGELFRLCKERWSRNVALAHDYDLYEFTIFVRLGSEPKLLLPVD